MLNCWRGLAEITAYILNTWRYSEKQLLKYFSYLYSTGMLDILTVLAHCLMLISFIWDFFFLVLCKCRLIFKLFSWECFTSSFENDHLSAVVKDNVIHRKQLQFGQGLECVGPLVFKWGNLLLIIELLLLAGFHSVFISFGNPKA